MGSISDVPTTGTATYTGHVIANVQSAGFVAGSFSNTVNFGARTGTVSVTNLDNTNYSGNVNFNNDPRNFGGTILAPTQRRRPHHGLAGQLLPGRAQSGRRDGRKRRPLRRTNYLGSGIFAASKR